MIRIELDIPFLTLDLSPVRKKLIANDYVKKIALISVYILLLITGCKLAQKDEVKGFTFVTTDAEKSDSGRLDGYWILTNYIDSIFEDRAIGNHRLYPI